MRIARPSSTSARDHGVGRRRRARPRSSAVERTEVAEQVVDPVGARCPGPAVGEPLELERDLVDRARVEQVAQLLGPEQLPQQIAVERERGRPALGERGVASYM